MNTDGHYENFPVASWLLPAQLRADVLALYRFARAADDIADEGDDSAPTRLNILKQWDQDLARTQTETAFQSEIVQIAALQPKLRNGRIRVEPLQALLSAFMQDITKVRYETNAELDDYCARSANPVGRLMLQLAGVHATDALIASDAVCSALQRINFWQDVGIDWQKGRIYIPQEDLRAFAVSEQHFAESKADAAWKALMSHQIDRTRRQMRDGVPVLRFLRGRMRLEIALTIGGGFAALDRIEHVHYNVFQHRAHLRLRDGPRVLGGAIRALRTL